MSLTSITLVGHAGRDPEVRFFESGTVVANFTLAVNKLVKDEAPDWFKVETWGKQAQVVRTTSAAVVALRSLGCSLESGGQLPL